MKYLFKLVENLKKNMKWYDFSILKGSVFFFTLFLITIWDWFRNLVFSISWYWYLILWVLLSAILIKKMFK